MVASNGSPSPLRGRGVSIPFIAGQWSLRRKSNRGSKLRLVSIPFIAGQWSLLFHPRGVGGQRRGAFQSPSLRGSGRFVASVCLINRQMALVSIPFIAGQWSLPPGGCASEQRAAAFQSPSLRGSGRFHGHHQVSPHPTPVSIPFIAGQWSLPCARGAMDVGAAEFQSPSLRGSGRFTATSSPPSPPCGWFQSPSLRGSGRFLPPGALNRRRMAGFNPLHCGAVVASGGRPDRPAGRPGFNPLHCGAVVASIGRSRWRRRHRDRFNPLHCGAVVASN